MKKNIKNCLVTGGAGFIGSHLTKKLLNKGWKVTVVDDLSEGKWENLPRHKNLKKVKASILDNISRLISGKDVIFHLAALPRLQRSLDDPLKTHRVNIDGTLNLLMLAKKYKVKRFIFSSSSSVYGSKNKIPYRESMIPNPLVPYSLHKVVGEEYCRLFSQIWGVGTVCLRYFNVYGPGMNPYGAYATVIPKFINLMSKDKAPIVNGDGRQTRDFTFVSDVVEANILAAKSNLTGEIINIGYGKSTSIISLVGLLNELLGKNIKPLHGPNLIESKTSMASNTKARKVLNWKPKVPLREGLKKTIKYYI